MYDFTLARGSPEVADANIESTGSKHGLFSISSALAGNPPGRFFRPIRKRPICKSDLSENIALKTITSQLYSVIYLEINWWNFAWRENAHLRIFSFRFMICVCMCVCVCVLCVHIVFCKDQ